MCAITMVHTSRANLKTKVDQIVEDIARALDVYFS
jgi:hypothetical protein